MCLEKLSRARVSIMTPDDFRQSLTADKPPLGLTDALAGLWWDGKGDWARALSIRDRFRIDWLLMPCTSLRSTC